MIDWVSKIGQWFSYYSHVWTRGHETKGVGESTTWSWVDGSEWDYNRFSGGMWLQLQPFLHVLTDALN